MGRGHHGQDLYAWDNEFGSEVKVRLQRLSGPHLMTTLPGSEALHGEPDVGEQR